MKAQTGQYTNIDANLRNSYHRATVMACISHPSPAPIVGVSTTPTESMVFGIPLLFLSTIFLLLLPSFRARLVLESNILAFSTLSRPMSSAYGLCSTIFRLTSLA